MGKVNQIIPYLWMLLTIFYFHLIMEPASGPMDPCHS